MSGGSAAQAWGTIRYLGTLAVIYFALRLFATEFDETEMRTLVTIAAALGAGKIVEPTAMRIIKGVREKSPDDPGKAQG